MTKPASSESGLSQRRIFRVVMALSGHETLGLQLAEVQRAAEIANPSTAHRDLQLLKEIGVAEQIAETGRWRLGPKLVQIALAFTDNLDKSERRLGEIRQRFTRLP